MTGPAQFLAAALDPALPAPRDLHGPRGRPAGKRFDVYRNNIAVGLTEALEAGFPALRRLVGAEFFTAMAGVYLRRHPPGAPVLADYGAALPAFLETFSPAASLPYLADVARLELAVRKAYHAADPPAFDPEALRALSPERLVAARLTLAPATLLVRSDWPIVGIWTAQTRPDAPAPASGPETALVTRPQFDPQVTALSAAEALFVETLGAGSTLGAAAECATDHAPEFDLARIFGLLLAQKAITAMKEGSQP